MCSNKCPLPTTHTPLGRGKATGTVRAPLGPKALCTQPQWLLPGRMIVPLLGTFKVPGGSLGSHAAQCHSSRTRPIRETRQETIHVTCPRRPLPRVYPHTEWPLHQLHVHPQPPPGSLPSPPSSCIPSSLQCPHLPGLPAMPFAECHLLPKESLRWHLSSPRSEQAASALAWLLEP